MVSAERNTIRVRQCSWPSTPAGRTRPAGRRRCSPRPTSSTASRSPSPARTSGCPPPTTPGSPWSTSAESPSSRSATATGTTCRAARSSPAARCERRVPGHPDPGPRAVRSTHDCRTGGCSLLVRGSRGLATPTACRRARSLPVTFDPDAPLRPAAGRHGHDPRPTWSTTRPCRSRRRGTTRTSSSTCFQCVGPIPPAGYPGATAQLGPTTSGRTRPASSTDRSG